jgi:Spy/CpxP family protein refolding chaperone
VIMNRFAIPATVIVEFFFLAAASGLTRAQSSPPAPVQPPRTVSPAARPMSDPRTTDEFAGLKFTDEQKAKIDDIHQRTATRKNAVVKSDKLDADQKQAMVAGLGRMERGEIVKLLTPEQQKEVLKRVHAEHGAAQEEQKPSLPQWDQLLIGHRCGFGRSRTWPC